MLEGSIMPITKDLVINDIYAGKPDANDEIKEKGYEEFVNSYIKPSGIDIDRLASTMYGTPYFVMGDKGTGKTALLHFLETHVRTVDSAACSSFMFFESGYSQVDRVRLNTISKAISTPVTVDTNIASTGKDLECDFTYVWRWQFYQKIIDDNHIFNDNLFVDDENWQKFNREISKIDKTISSGKMRIPAKINFSATSDPQHGTFTPNLSIEPLDLSKQNFSETNGYRDFIRIIEAADNIIGLIKRTDIPYYIFIDELEAYRSENDIFFRDLRMIRDLLFTVKRMNDTFRQHTKFICSVRLEIVSSINRFVQSNQLHKIMQGYDERLVWEYTNTNSFNHPIISILMKRIEIAEERNGNTTFSRSELIRKWFVTPVYNTHICTYILDNTWHRPRDIVRLILAAQSKNSKNFSSFNQNTFETCMQVYSKQCLVEVQEEMRALYTAEEIEHIFNCLRGFKTIFSFAEISARISRLFPASFLDERKVGVLNDLYRIGVIGNYLNRRTSTQWEYKAQYSLLTDDPWQIIVHPSLHIELAISGRKDRYFYEKDDDQSTTNIPHLYLSNDKTVICKECGDSFAFTVGEQTFYADRGFQQPQRCKKCRDARKNMVQAQKEFYTTICSACGGEARIPFHPTTGRLVYCNDCFAQIRENAY